MKQLVPIKEYPTFIECEVWDVDLFGERTFLYKEVYNKELVNTEKLNKLLNYDSTVEYLEHQIELLTLVDDKQLLNLAQTIYEKLTNKVGW